MSDRTFAPTCYFSLVVCQHPNGKFLVVNESRNRGWWLPGGGVDDGETLQDGAIRETKEEAGIDIILCGILRVEPSVISNKGSRQRVIFYGIPKNPNQKPKSIPDSESNFAEWKTLEEIKELTNNRGDELIVWGNYLKSGGRIHPMSILRPEYKRVHEPSVSLYNLIKQDNIDVKGMLKEIGWGAEISRQFGDNNDSLMHIVAQKGNIGLCNFLLDYKINVHLLDNIGRSCLHIASLYGHTQVIRLLLKNGCRINQCDIYGCTPLHLALNKTTYDYLVSKGASENVYNQKGEKPKKHE